jgi:hypothetical protein
MKMTKQRKWLEKGMLKKNCALNIADQYEGLWQ